MILRLTMLGGFLAEIESPDGARKELRITARKARALLAYVASVPRHRAPREKLANLLWGDRVGDQQARQSLRQALVVLRQELSAAGIDLFLPEGDEVAIRPGLLIADVAAFATLAQSESLEDLETACALYRGEFLADLSVDAEAFEEWRRSESARLEDLAAHAFAEAATRWDDLNDARGVGAALRLTALDPLREDWQRLLLRLLARHRGRDAALAQATSFSEHLRRELDAAPSAETVALLEDIRRGTAESGRRATDKHPLAPDAIARAQARRSPSPERAGMAPEADTPVRRGAINTWLAGAALAAVLLLAGAAYLAWNRSTVNAVAPAAQRGITPDPSWQSPSGLNGVKANESALSQTGVYPVVVLPFSTDAPPGSPEQRVAAQVTDDLINDLSRAPSTRVISRQTSRLYAGRSIDVATIGAELGVRYVVDGSVRRQDGRLRVNVALIDTHTRLQIWSDRFDSAESDRLDLQEQMTRGLARQLHVTVTLANRGAARGDPALNEMIANAWAGVFRSVTVGHTGESETRFQEILKRKPDTVPALVGIAATHLALMGNLLAFDTQERATIADEALKKALARNPASSIAHYFLGVLHKHRHQFQEAHASLLKTLELNPSHAPAYAHLGHTLMLLGRVDEALEPIRYAMRLSPKDPLLGYWYVMAAEVERELGHDEAARDWLTQAVKVSPGNPRMHVVLAGQCAVLGDTDCASRHAAEARRLSPQLTIEKLQHHFAPRAQTKAGAQFLDGLRRAFGAT
jgi:TolB-like protein/DNA-binding SARP family transcriptional activator